VRFGEVEQRGIALTARGRDLYDGMVAEVDRRLAEAPAATTRVDVAGVVWRERLPASERELAVTGLGFFTYRVADGGSVAGRVAGGRMTLRTLIESGIVVPEPIVYEDFLPRSAAGIFQSNLTDEGSRDDHQASTFYDIGRLSDVIGLTISDPTLLYQAQQMSSLAAAQQALGTPIMVEP
jgi:uncharacterized glyoxalase superfamily metalloenzyme YdcJ